MSEKWTAERFIKASVERHGDKCDYSKVVYKNKHALVTIICKKHGAFKVEPNQHLRRGTGCKQCANEALVIRNTKHGKTKTPLHLVWVSIKQRCGNAKNRRYQDYGGRGIKMCAEWSSDFTVFERWAVSHGYEKGLHIDRIDNNKGYGPDNCRFVTAAENNKNKRNNIVIRHGGFEFTMDELAVLYGLPRDVIYGRVKRAAYPENWSDAQINWLAKPFGSKKWLSSFSSA